MKKLLIFCLTVCLTVLPMTLHASAAQASLSGKDYVQAGSTAQVFLNYTPADAAQGVQGVLTFDTQLMTLISMEAVPEGWVAETGAEGTFIVYDDSLEAPISGTNTLVCLTFAVQDTVPANTELTVGVTLEDDHGDTAEAQFVMTVQGFLMGDVNADGEINDSDRVLLSRFLADWDISAYTFDPAAADINRDGKLSAIDRMILARYLAGWGEPYTRYFS